MKVIPSRHLWWFLALCELCCVRRWHFRFSTEWISGFPYWFCERVYLGWRLSGELLLLKEGHPFGHKSKIWAESMCTNYFYHYVLNYTLAIVKPTCFLMYITTDHLNPTPWEWHQLVYGNDTNQTFNCETYLLDSRLRWFPGHHRPTFFPLPFHFWL